MSSAPATRDEPLVLRPPLQVMRPEAVSWIPAPDALPGGVRYEVKLDGFRCLAFACGSRPPVLQSRSGRNMAAEFPAIAAAVAALPAGLVLDGELCAWRSGRMAFEELLRSRTAREAAGVSLALVVFDVLALPGRDVRALPLHERIGLLTGALTHFPPQIQPVMATTDVTEAQTWYDVLGAQGIEGLVCKGLDSPYRARGAGRYWVKIRHHDTVDATAVAFTGTARRPGALLLQLADGTRVLSSPRLDPVQARTLAEALANRTGDPVQDPDHGTLHPLAEPVTVEVRAGSGRHGGYRYLRLRGD